MLFRPRSDPSGSDDMRWKTTQKVRDDQSSPKTANFRTDRQFLGQPPKPYLETFSRWVPLIYSGNN